MIFRNKLFTLLIMVNLAFSFTEIHTTRCNSQIQIDGILNEKIWQETSQYSGLKTFYPDIGKPLADATTVYTSYDNENLYFAFDCKADDPEKIQGTMTKRDGIYSEDYALVMIDSFNDKQNAYGFLVNPRGVQGDLIMNAQGNGDSSHDFIWQSAAKLNDHGYTVEMAIPLKSIRFNPGTVVRMGVGFGRQITQSSEKGLFPGLDPEKGGMLTQLSTIEYKNLSYDRTYEVLPSVTNNYKMTNQQGTLKEDFNRTNVGVTAKIGLTPTLTLDGTYNPDFSQIEADAGQVTANLRSNIFYSEKRPFFMEGVEMFDFAATGGGSAVMTAVHTRNIIDPIAGAKLSGKVGDKNAISTLIAADESPKYNDDTMNQNAYFGLFRYKRLLNNSSYIGGLYSSRFLGNSYNQVTALDAKYRLTGKMQVEGNAFYALNKPEDSQQTSNSYNTDIQYTYSDKKYYFKVGYHDISKNFNLASGFVPRDGIRTGTSFEARSFYFNNTFLRKIRISSYNFFQYDKYDNQNEYYINLSTNFHFPGNTYFRLQGNLGTESYVGNIYEKDGFSFFFKTQFVKQLNFQASYYQKGTPWYDEDDPYQATVGSLWSQLEYKPTSSLKTSFRVIRSLFHKKSTGKEVLDYQIYRSRTTYQINKYLFLRATVEYNAYEEELMSDLLVSFTYIPGTVVHLGYGSLYDQTQFKNGDYVNARNFMEMERGLFIKASYNWRL